MVAVVHGDNILKFPEMLVCGKYLIVWLWSDFFLLQKNTEKSWDSGIMQESWKSRPREECIVSYWPKGWFFLTFTRYFRFLIKNIHSIQLTSLNEVTPCRIFSNFACLSPDGTSPFRRRFKLPSLTYRRQIAWDAQNASLRTRKG